MWAVVNSRGGAHVQQAGPVGAGGPLAQGVGVQGAGGRSGGGRWLVVMAFLRVGGVDRRVVMRWQRWCRGRYSGRAVGPRSQERGCCGRRCRARRRRAGRRSVRDRVSGRTRVAIRPPSRLPITAAAVNTPMTVQSMSMPLPGPGDQRGGAVDGDDQQRGADRDRHREVQRQHQRRDHQEAAADAEEPGHQPDRDGGDEHLRARGQAQTKRGLKVMIGTSNGARSRDLRRAAGCGGHPAAGASGAATASISTENPASSTAGATWPTARTGAGDGSRGAEGPEEHAPGPPGRVRRGGGRASRTAR